MNLKTFEFLHRLRAMVEDSECNEKDIYSFVQKNVQLLPKLDSYDYSKKIKMLEIDSAIRKWTYNFTDEEWKDPHIMKWALYMTHQKNNVFADFMIGKNYAGAYYYKTKEDVDSAIEEAGGIENIREYLGYVRDVKRKYGVMK